MIFEMSPLEQKNLKRKQDIQKKKEKVGRWVKIPHYYIIKKRVYREPIKTTKFVSGKISDEQAIEKYFKNRKKYGGAGRRSIFIESM